MRNGLFAMMVGTALVAGCDGSMTGSDSLGDVGAENELTGIEENEEISFAGTLRAGDWARVCNTGGSGLRQRSGPGLSYTILRAMPEGASTKILSQSGSWYKNDWGGRVGWSYGYYLCATSSGGTSGGGGSGGGSFSAPVTRDGAIQIGKAATGFSYWWGGAAFASGGEHGACYGSCGNCSHRGRYGADCSGLIGKVWQLPPAMPMSANRHPYSTYHYKYQSNYWHGISRGNTSRADTLVYHSGGAGHIVLFESGSAWGSMWTYECRGCAYGCVHNVRTAGSAYVARRRDNF